MARNRQLSAAIRVDEKVNEWPIELRYFWTQLWGYCDDFGRGRYVSKLVKADAFPLDDEVTAAKIGRWMQALEMAGVIQAYEVEGKRYFFCVNWAKYQRLSRPTTSDIPEPLADAEQLHADVNQLRAEGKGKGREVEGEGKLSAAALTPFCSKHPQGTDSPCRACGNARRVFDAATTVEKNRATVPGIITEPDCGLHPGRPKRGCDRCAEMELES